MIILNLIKIMAIIGISLPTSTGGHGLSCCKVCPKALTQLRPPVQEESCYSFC